MNIFVFDLETIPDYESGAKLYGLHALSPSDQVAAMQQLRREKTGSDFMPLHLHKIVAISAVLRIQDNIKVWSLGEINANEAEIINRFFNGLNKYTPTLVSWNGTGFDLPVLHYRCLLHGISAPRYWEVGNGDQDFRWNNYLNRYHYRHLDLMDILAAYNSRANAPLDEIASLLGFPGKMGMHGSKVWEYYLQGDLTAIRNYCETDVINTYLIYLRFELMRGQINQQQYQDECLKLKNYLIAENKTHFNEFIAAWGKQ